MDKEINLEDAKNALMKFAKDRGMTEACVNEKWSVAYKKNAQEKFELHLIRFLNGMSLFRKASDHDDRIAAAYGLVEAKVAASMLRDFFGALDEDIVRAMIDFDRPIIPSDYEPPAHYQYKKN